VANIWMPMLDPAAQFDSRVWKTATPFHTDDVTADWRRHHESEGTLLRLPCRGLISPWSEVFTEEYLRQKREEMGPMAYARAYELVPLSSDLLVFRPEWTKFYRPGEIPNGTRAIAAIDWGYGKKQQDRDDPDYSVCIVGEVDHARNLYLTDILRVRESFPDFARMAVELVERRGCMTVFAEANGPQKGVFDQFRSLCRQPVIAVERTTDKHLRAASAQPFVEQGKLSFPAGQNGQVDNSFRPVVDEMLSFPAGTHDDTVDVVVDLCTAAANGTVVTSGGAVTLSTQPTRMFDSRGVRRRMFG
jgi:predicted phage terminase large subunit-like protein